MPWVLLGISEIVYTLRDLIYLVSTNDDRGRIAIEVENMLGSVLPSKQPVDTDFNERHLKWQTLMTDQSSKVRLK